MNKLKINILLSALVIFSFSACKPDDPEPEQKKDDTVALSLSFKPVFKGNALSWTNPYITGAGDTVMFDKVKFILSDFTLEKQNGELVTLKDQYAYISLKEGRDSVILTSVPKGDYKSVRFQVGLDSAINHGNQAQWGLNHPLNPSLSDMHWSWSGGYIFNIIEGYFKKNGSDAAFTFHIATLKNARSYTYVYDYTLSRNAAFVFDVNMDKYFSNVINFSLKTDGAFSHSGNNDAVMAKFMQNVNGVLELNSFK
jgi:hypothetical protein